MRYFVVLLLLVAGCATTPPQESPQVERISPEELERIMPKPVPNLPLEEIVRLSREGAAPGVIIDKIRQSGSSYALTPSQMVELNRQGVAAEVLDYVHSAHEQAVREGFADEISKREREHRAEVERLRREGMLRAYRYCDPFWGPYPYSHWPYPYRWRAPYCW